MYPGVVQFETRRRMLLDERRMLMEELHLQREARARTRRERRTRLFGQLRRHQPAAAGC